MRDREDGKEKWGEPSRKHDCSCALYVNYGIKWMNQILSCHIILHQEASHSTKCGLGGSRVRWFIVTEQLGQCSEKQKELESSAKDPEWLWLLQLFTSRKSISMLCTMIQDAVFAMVPFYRYGDWVLEKNEEFAHKLNPFLKIFLMLASASHFPEKLIYLFQEKTDKLWYVFPCMLNSPSLAFFPVFLPNL